LSFHVDLPSGVSERREIRQAKKSPRLVLGYESSSDGESKRLHGERIVQTATIDCRSTCQDYPLAMLQANDNDLNPELLAIDYICQTDRKEKCPDTV